MLDTGRVSVTKAMTRDEQERERDLKNELVSLNTQVYRENRRPRPDRTRLAELTAQLERVRLRLEDFQTNLYAAHPELRVQRGDMRPLTLDATNALLTDARTALLEFW